VHVVESALKIARETSRCLSAYVPLRLYHRGGKHASHASLQHWCCLPHALLPEALLVCKLQVLLNTSGQLPTSVPTHNALHSCCSRPCRHPPVPRSKRGGGTKVSGTQYALHSRSSSVLLQHLVLQPLSD